MGLSAALFVLMLLLAWLSSGVRMWLRSLAIVVFGWACCAWWFIDQLSGNGIDAAVVYHMRAGMHGAGIGDLAGKLVVLGFSALMVAVLALVPIVLRRSRSRRNNAAAIAFLAVTLLGWITSPLVRDVFRLYAKAHPAGAASALQQYRSPIDGDRGGKRNVVLLYLESVERSYLDQAVFPGLTPNLHEIAAKGMDFTNVASLDGSGWTIGGIVSSLCGVPLVLSDEGNQFGSMSRFMPGAHCLSDQLAERGYQMEFVGGAAAEFAGKGPFLAQHGFTTIIDRQYFVDRAVPQDRFSPWGVQDDVMLDTMASRFDALSEEGKPFMLAGLTLGTHPPDGSIAKSCRGRHYNGAGDGEQMLDAVACTDRLVAKFVSHLQASPAWKDTVLVIASDHVSMPNDVQSMLEKVADRTNLLFVLGDGIAPRRISRPGATIDTASLISDQLGLSPAIGFGRSLSRDSTEPGMSAVVRAGGDVAPYLEYAKSLWRLGSLTSGLRMDGDRLIFGDQSVLLPVMLAADPSGSVKTLGLSGIRSQAPVVDFSVGDQLLYADRCAGFSRVSDAADWCVWYQSGRTAPVVLNQSSLKQLTSISDLVERGQRAPARDEFSASYVVRQSFAPEQSDVGEFRDGHIYTSGRGGTLVYGPFVDLCAGTYRLKISGSANAPLSAWSDFSAERIGAFGRMSLTATDGETGFLDDREVYVPAPLSRAEIRVFVKGDDHVRLDGYSLLPVYPIVRPTDELLFDEAGNGSRLLGCGWGGNVGGARLTNSPHSRIRFSVAPEWRNRSWKIAISTAASDAASVGARVRLRVGGEVIGRWTLGKQNKTEVFSVPAHVDLEPSAVDLTLDLEQPVGQPVLALTRIQVFQPKSSSGR